MHTLALLLLIAALGCAGRTAAPGGDVAAARGAAVPRYDVAYQIAMPDPASHLYDVQLDVGGLVGDTLELQLPVWSPGRYARMDFAKNVQEFSAAAADGRPLAWDKTNGSLWRVHTAGARRARVRYRVYANNLSGTFSVLDTLHANWNGASIFMYVVGHKPDPVTLRVVPPAGWRVLNGWSERVGDLDYRFPNYDVLIDTPTEVAPGFDVDTFRADGILYRVMVHHNGPQQGQRPRFVRDLERIVRYQNTVLGPPPIDTYTFLYNIGFRGGDGMEHLNSTQIMNPAPWTDTAAVLPGISTGSHEYFHTWNVKRIRPAALGPFDYAREQHQPSLWIAEGWTNYYGGMTLHRAGIIDKARLYQSLARMIRYNSETPGRKELSARMSSFHAPFWDGAAHAMETNGRNTWISYYLKGEALAMLLDLELRARTGGARSLDDVLRLLKARTWEAPSASYYLQGRGYTEADVERAVSDVAGADMRPWFERYVAGVEDLPWSETLVRAGLRLVVRDGGTDQREYVLDDDPAATGEQARVREGWLGGR